MNRQSKEVAIKRVKTLFNLARRIVHTDPELAQRYINISRKVAMASRIRLPMEHKYQICKYCKSYIGSSSGCRVRLKQKRTSHIVITCFNCGGRRRIPLKNRQRQLKRKKGSLNKDSK